MTAFQVATPYGPRRWAQRRRKAPSAAIAAAASPARAASTMRRPAATAASRTGRSASRASGSAMSTSIHDVVVAGAQDGERGVGVAAADGLGQVGDRAGEAVDAAEDDDPVADRDAGRRLGRGHRLPRDLGEAGACRLAHQQRVGGRADEVAEHGAGLDRGELLRVADEDQPRVAADRLEQPRHQRERHHRRLVDDRRRRAAAGCGGRAGSGWRCRRASRAAGAGSTPSSRAVAPAPARSARAPPLPRARPPPAARRPCRSARRARRAGVGAPAASACSSSRTRMRVTVVVLPVPGPPPTTARRRSTHVAAARRWRSGSSPANSRASPSASTAGVDVARGLVAGEEVGGDEALVPPVAVEVERRADEAERSVLPAVLADGDERARGEAVDPRLGLRPRQRLQVDRRRRRRRRGGARSWRGRRRRSRAGARARRARPRAARSRPPRRRAARAGARRGRRRRPSTPASLKARSTPAARRT